MGLEARALLIEGDRLLERGLAGLEAGDDLFEALERSGREYYPKLLCAVPFTPVTAPKPAPSASVDTVKHRPMACISACRPSASDCKKATAGTTNTPVSAVIPPVSRPHNRPSQA